MEPAAVEVGGRRRSVSMIPWVQDSVRPRRGAVRLPLLLLLVFSFAANVILAIGLVLSDGKPGPAIAQPAGEVGRSQRDVAVGTGASDTIACNESAAAKALRFDEAIQFVKEESERVIETDGAFVIPWEYYYATSAMNYAQARLRPIRYARLKAAKTALPVTIEQCLVAEAGICGNQVAFVEQCLNEFAIDTRSVEIYRYGTPDNHIMLEVWYDRAWRLFDVTWGTVYRRPGAPVWDLLPASDVLSSLHARDWAATNRTDLWFQVVLAKGNAPLAYLDWLQADVIIDGVGVIHLLPEESAAVGTTRYVTQDRPGYIGRNRPANLGSPGSLTCTLVNVPSNVVTMRINVTGLAGQGRLRVLGEHGEVSAEFKSIKPGVNELHVSGVSGEEIRLSVDATGEDGIAYIVYREIALACQAHSQGQNKDR